MGAETTRKSMEEEFAWTQAFNPGAPYPFHTIEGSIEIARNDGPVNTVQVEFYYADAPDQSVLEKVRENMHAFAKEMGGVVVGDSLHFTRVYDARSWPG